MHTAVLQLLLAVYEFKTPAALRFDGRNRWFVSSRQSWAFTVKYHGSFRKECQRDSAQIYIVRQYAVTKQNVVLLSR